MMNSRLLASGLLAAAFALSFSGARADELIVNGGFETGDFTGWSTANGGSGAWFVTSGNSAPDSGEPTVGPASGNYYAVTGQGGPGSHSLWQDFTVGAGQTVNVSFDMFDNDFSDAGPLGGNGNLNYSDGANQHVEVDILDSTGSTILDNLFYGSTPAAGPNPYQAYSFNISSAVAAGGTYELRFAEVDNQFFNSMGVDNVSVTDSASSVPDATSTLMCLGAALPVLAGLRRRFRR
jgi:hypothetical protein